MPCGGGTPSSLALSYLATGLSFGGREQWKEVGEEDPSDEIDQQEADGQGPSNQIDRMVSAFTSRDITQMAPYLIEDVRRINSSTQNYISDDLSSVFDALNSGGGMAAKHSVNLKALLDSLSAEQRAQLLNGEGENDVNKLSQTVLIMDEATSALDAKTEMDVVNAVRDRGITTIVVAHRLSTVRDCDEIIVMEHGRIIERGTHDELMAADGLYARLIKTE